MKKIIMMLTMLTMTLVANAQFEAGKTYVNASLSGMDLSFSGTQQGKFDIGAMVGYFVEDQWLVSVQAGMHHPGKGGKATTTIGVGGRYYVLDNGLFLGLNGKLLFSPGYNDIMPGIELGTIKAADGKTDLYYRLITPPNMDKSKKYPTLVYVYGGPHSQLVTDEWLGGGNLYFLYLAQQGYVVFTVDNRGTDNRGFEFESCTHRQLGTIEMADQMEGVKFLQSLPF